MTASYCKVFQNWVLYGGVTVVRTKHFVRSFKGLALRIFMFVSR